jgi:hypothetical protein
MSVVTKKAVKTRHFHKTGQKKKIAVKRVVFEKISNKKSSIVYLIPSEADRVVVQTAPSLIISCIVPPTTRQVRAKYDKYSSNKGVAFELETPYLVWQQSFILWNRKHSVDELYYPCFTCGWEKFAKHKNSGRNFYKYFLHVLDEISKDIQIAPYDMANIDIKSGWVCWGSIKTPRSLRQANFNFWHATLNNSTGRFSPCRSYDYDNLSYKTINETFVDFLKKSRTRYFKNAKSALFGYHNIATKQPTAGVFMSMDTTLVEKFNHSLAKSSYGHKILVGFANRNTLFGAWQIDLPDSRTIYLKDKDLFVQ